MHLPISPVPSGKTGASAAARTGWRAPWSSTRPRTRRESLSSRCFMCMICHAMRVSAPAVPPLAAPGTHLHHVQVDGHLRAVHQRHGVHHNVSQLRPNKSSLASAHGAQGSGSARHSEATRLVRQLRVQLGAQRGARHLQRDVAVRHAARHLHRHLQVRRELKRRLLGDVEALEITQAGRSGRGADQSEAGWARAARRLRSGDAARARAGRAPRR